MVKESKTEANNSGKMFATGLGILMATLGSAVGLGNIWKFPTLTGTNGGAAFIFIYIACALVIGLPVMAAEQMLGRSSRGDAVTAFRKLAPGKLWWLIGAGGVLAAFMIMAFYTEVAGWVLAYVFKSMGQGLMTTDPAVTSAAFGALITDPVRSLRFQWIDLLITGAIILMGVTKGIEAATKRLLPLLFVLLVLVSLRSLTLPGAAEGLAFLFAPDFSAVTVNTVLEAMGLAFFKLSIGMGCMITYGAYYRNDQNIPATASKVVLSDLAISLLAGIAIFPAVFAFGFEPAAGPSLLFITIPAVFSSMPLGNVFMVIFFALTFIASIGAQISLLEVITAFLENTFKLNRKQGTAITLVSLAMVGSLAALSNSVLADVTLFGLTFFDLFDFASSNILLPVGGFFITLFAGWFWGKSKYFAQISNEGSLKNERAAKFLFTITRFVSPVLVLIVLLRGLKII
jgi:neurotransmitter:Na+ symporter, NSS family